MGHFCGTLLWDTLVGYSSETLQVGKSFARDFLKSSHVESAKRAFRTRLPQEVCKASVSYETSSKSHASSLQNEHFVRDFLLTSHAKVSNTSISYETSSKSQAGVPVTAHTSSSPATSTATRNLTIPCACQETFRIHTSDAHKVLRLPRNVTSITPRNSTTPCTRVFRKSVPPECHIRVSHKRALQECSARVPHKSAPQECPTRECPTRVSYKSVPQECPTRVSVIQGVPQECTRVSHKGFPKECVLQECPTNVFPTRVFVFEYVFAFGFVGSILLNRGCSFGRHGTVLTD